MLFHAIGSKWQMADKYTVKRICQQILSALASSFSNTGDIILIGKNKHDMLAAFNRMKELAAVL